MLELKMKKFRTKFGLHIHHVKEMLKIYAHANIIMMKRCKCLENIYIVMSLDIYLRVKVYRI